MRELADRCEVTWMLRIVICACLNSIFAGSAIASGSISVFEFFLV
jgi:hypothetical protein